MKKLKTKQDLIDAVLEQIKVDVHCDDCTPIEELLKFCSTDILLSYLPEDELKQFKHLKDGGTA